MINKIAYRSRIIFRIGAWLFILQQVSSALYAQSDSARRRNIIAGFFQQQASVRYIYSTRLSGDGKKIVWNADGPDGGQVWLKSFTQPDSAFQITAFAGTAANETEPQWSPDNREIAFLSDAGSNGQMQLFITNANNHQLVQKKPLTQFNGYISHLKWSPDGKYLSVLYVEKASREPSPMAAQNKAVGLIDSILNRNVQRIAIINRRSGESIQASPPGLYVFEYDWSPDSRQFCYTASAPPGDDNWYIAQLYLQSVALNDTAMIYHPARQIALPQWSPDGKKIAFIEGLMSDQGGTGGEIFTLSVAGNKQKQNLTPGRLSTPAWYAWRPDGSILFTEFAGGSVAVNMLNSTNGKVIPLWKADESIRAGNEEVSLSVSGSLFACIRSSWNMLPEVWYGTPGKLKQVTQLNTNNHIADVKARNIEWVNEGNNVQGWLLYPAAYDSTKKYPMLIAVHGGPAWITTPTWSAPDFNTTVYTQLGYFVFFPNPRGSYGQGEVFTLANRRDWGFGDLRDIVSGIDAVLQKVTVDNKRIGILGWSYGGSMAMMAITQTNRFRAAVAGAGAADWESYYGQNAIDKWMLSYFGASPYDDLVAYTKCSAMTYIKQAKTPTLVLAGELDGEAPPAQAFQFWHALKELNVPTNLFVYPEEGHSFYKFDDMIDVSVRTIEWFNKYMTTD